jgi:hypothetical protein
VNLACQFLRVAGGSSAIFDPGNFSYAFAIKRKGDADYFGLTVDPEIYLNVRSCSFPRILLSLPFS